MAGWGLTFRGTEPGTSGTLDPMPGGHGGGTTHATTSPQRIPALDGLRGCAILLVIAAHTGTPQNQSLGAAGVTLFFVLSGYLITSILLRGHLADGRPVRLKSFYIRRARRLLPALAVLLFFDAAVRVASGQTLVPVFLAGPSR